MLSSFIETTGHQLDQIGDYFFSDNAGMGGRRGKWVVRYHEFIDPVKYEFIYRQAPWEKDG